MAIGNSSYWFNGRVVPGVAQNEDVGTRKYWFQGKCMPLLVTNLHPVPPVGPSFRGRAQWLTYLRM